VDITEVYLIAVQIRFETMKAWAVFKTALSQQEQEQQDKEQDE